MTILDEVLRGAGTIYTPRVAPGAGPGPGAVPAPSDLFVAAEPPATLDDIQRGIRIFTPPAVVTPGTTPSLDDALRGAGRIYTPPLAPGLASGGGSSTAPADLVAFADAMNPFRTEAGLASFRTIPGVNPTDTPTVEFARQANGSYRRVITVNQETGAVRPGVAITDTTTYWVEGSGLFSEGGTLTIPGRPAVTIPAGTFSIGTTGTLTHRAGTISPATRTLARLQATANSDGSSTLPDGSKAYLQLGQVGGFYSLHRPGGQVISTGATLPAATYFFNAAGDQPAGTPADPWRTGNITIAGTAHNADLPVDSHTTMIMLGRLNHAGVHFAKPYHYFTAGEGSPLPTFGQFYANTTGAASDPHIGGTISQQYLTWCAGPAATDAGATDSDGNKHPVLYYFLDTATNRFIPYAWIGGCKRVTILAPGAAGNTSAGSTQYRADMGGRQRVWTADTTRTVWSP